MKQGVYMRAFASDAKEAVIDIIGVIGWEVAYETLKDMLRSIPESIERVVFEIYSPGGDVFEGNGIIQEIGELGKRVTTVAHVQVAASIATLIAVACNERVMASNGRFLIHNPWSMAQGDAQEMEKTAEHLRATEQEAAVFYAQRCGGTAEEMLALMAEEKWLMAEEAKELGFVEEINDPFEAEDFAEVKAEIQAAGKWPTALAELPETEPEQEQEVQDELDDKDRTEGESQGEGEDGPDDQHADDEGEEGKENKEDGPDDKTQEVGASYDSAKMDGIVVGRAQVEREYLDKAKAWADKLQETDKLARKHQADKDKLENKLTDLREESAKSAKALRDELEEVTRKLKQHVSGSLTFEPSIETWEAALAAEGTYAEAAKKHPELLTAWKAARRQEGK